MKNQTKTLSMLLLSSLIACSTPKQEEIENPLPNLILIMTDDQGYGDLACHGNPFIKTPHLDKLYEESIRLTNFHVGTTCAPTRAGLMTGRNGNRAGVWHTIAGRSQLRASEMTIADVFKHNQYKTALFGKWHLGDNYPFLPHYRGFDETLYHGGGGVVQQPDYWENDYFDDTYFRNGKPEKQEGYCTDVWFDAAMEFIEKEKESPFFCYLATNAPHGPFWVDSTYIKPYLENPDVPNPNFAGMISNFDENLGRLLQQLDELELRDNTILVFLTDNGTAAGARFDENGQVVQGFNAGMRSQKGSPYEGGHRVPCFVRWPGGGLAGGRDVAALTAHVDWLPTLIDLLQLQQPKSVKFDGANILPLLQEENPDTKWRERVLITDTQRAEYPVKWKKSATMMNFWRLINGTELYNVQTDPSQLNDLAEQHPEIVQQLRAAYESWWSELELGFNLPSRTILGQEGIREVTLYSHDWHEAEKKDGSPNLDRAGGHMVPWHHRHVRAGALINGYWEVFIAQDGRYRF